MACRVLRKLNLVVHLNFSKNRYVCVHVVVWWRGLAIFYIEPEFLEVEIQGFPGYSDRLLGLGATVKSYV